jgi:ribose 5-phosphate isomerase B
MQGLTFFCVGIRYNRMAKHLQKGEGVYLMKIAIGADHAGFPLKGQLVAHLRDQGHDVLDLGTDNPTEPKDYPDYARAVSEQVIAGKVERGIIVCGSGVGASIAASKMPGIFAALCHDTYSAHQGVEHDNMNVICLGSRVIGSALASEIVDAFLNATFEINTERHVRRHNKVLAIEKETMG